MTLVGKRAYDEDGKAAKSVDKTGSAAAGLFSGCDLVALCDI